MEKNKLHICISRTDSIGDVVLTLPLVGYLKFLYPQCKISFLCRTYTQPVVLCCKSIDEVLIWDEIIQLSEKGKIHFFQEKELSHFIHVFPNKSIAGIIKKAKIPNRIGSSHRLFHLFTCNKKVGFTRKKSSLHEAQLNFKLLKGMGVDFVPAVSQLTDFIDFSPVQKIELDEIEKTGQKRVLLHPLSQGSAVEWGIENFMKLALLLAENNCIVYISGTEKEGHLIIDHIPNHDRIINICGKYDLASFISFIATCDCLVAASTGPLHIASILDKKVIGLFSPLRPIHPGRWQPIGKNSQTITSKISCSSCKVPSDCNCMRDIQPKEVLEMLLN